MYLSSGRNPIRVYGVYLLWVNGKVIKSIPVYPGMEYFELRIGSILFISKKEYRGWWEVVGLKKEENTAYEYIRVGVIKFK